MPSLANPYKNRRPIIDPAHFFGRQKEILFLAEQMRTGQMCALIVSKEDDMGEPYNYLDLLMRAYSISETSLVQGTGIPPHSVWCARYGAHISSSSAKRIVRAINKWLKQYQLGSPYTAHDLGIRIADSSEKECSCIYCRRRKESHANTRA
jgi:hypothetical protein